MVEQLAFAEVSPKMTYDEIQEIVVGKLKNLKKLPSLIRASERRAAGKALIPHPDSIVLDPDQPEYMRFNLREQHLIDVGRTYTYNNRDMMYIAKAENLFNRLKGENEQDEKALDELRRIFAGLTPWGREGALDESREHVITVQKAMQDVDRLKNEKMVLESALEDLKSYDPESEQLLRKRFVDHMPAHIFQREYHYSPSTYNRKKKHAVIEFANLIGLFDE